MSCAARRAPLACSSSTLLLESLTLPPRPSKAGAHDVQRVLRSQAGAARMLQQHLGIHDGGLRQKELVLKALCSDGVGLCGRPACNGCATSDSGFLTQLTHVLTQPFGARQDYTKGPQSAAVL